MSTEIQVRLADWKQDQDQLMAIRSRVFIEEQKVPIEEEIDGLDPDCIHVLAAIGAQPVGTARMLPTHYIGRMCVLKAHRMQGIGGRMLSYLIDYARQHRIARLQLNAQVTALPFYQKYGFVVDSDLFLDAGIEHKHMILNL